MKPTGRLSGLEKQGRWRAALIALLLLAVAGCGREPPEYELIVPAGDRIKIPVSTVNDGKVHFYTYKYNGKNINFFVRTDGNKKLHTHFDACWSCFKYKMGFVVEGEYIRCIACNFKYKLSDEFWDFIGACAPIPLRSMVKEEFIEIELGAIQKGERLF
ncbi:MAG: Fe-S-containing protein [Thermodesulfobacteriota bacterium]